MKLLSITDQMNACIKHANRNNLPIHWVKIYQNKPLDNHNVIMTVGDIRDGHPYISVAVLVNMKKEQHCNESTWDIGRN